MKEMAEITEGSPAPAPARILPTHIGGEVQAQSPQERFRLRQEQLRAAPNLEDVLKGQFKERGLEPPTNVNLSLKRIQNFERDVREAQDLREVAKI